MNLSIHATGIHLFFCVVPARPCVAIPTVSNSMITSVDTNKDGSHVISYGEAVTFKCIRGFRPEVEATIWCKKNGLLEPTSFLCERKEYLSTMSF